MAFRSDTYTSLSNRLKDWLTDTSDTGGNVTSRVLDLLNRARQSLWMERPWASLVKRAALTLSSGTTYTLPSDCGEILDVYHDSDSDGRPDWHYYKDSHDTAVGYYVTETYSRTAGFTKTVTFLATPSNAPYVKYKALLDDFTNTEGDDATEAQTEYLFFPAELLLVQAQMHHAEDAGTTDTDGYKALERKRTRELANYMQSQQYQNYEYRMVHRDDAGVEVENERYNLNAGPESDPSPFDPSYDLRGD